MRVLVVGASGATGRLLVQALVDRGARVRAIVRAGSSLPIESQASVEVVRGSVLELSDAQVAEQVCDCDAIASCLGHNLTFKGIFGEPRRLVADSVRRLCEAVQSNRPPTPVRVVLMNTTGVRNPSVDPTYPLGDRIVIGLLRRVLPPHVDNEDAAAYLRESIGAADPFVEWVIVRPDNLVDEPAVTDYDLHPSPTRSVIFGARQTSRVNVADFMAAMCTGPPTYVGQTPVILNCE